MISKGIIKNSNIYSSTSVGSMLFIIILYKYIKKLISHKIILVPNTSKTELEIKDFMKELGIKLPFICENGSAIYNLNLINIL